MKLKHDELRELHQELKTGMDARSCRALLCGLAKHVFGESSPLYEAAVTELPTKECDDESADEAAEHQLGDLLEEICLHDEDNANEVKDLRAMLKQNLFSKLTKTRDAMRRSKAQAKADKKAKAKAKRTPKKKYGGKHADTRKPTRKCGNFARRAHREKPAASDVPEPAAAVQPPPFDESLPQAHGPCADGNAVELPPDGGEQSGAVAGAGHAAVVPAPQPALPRVVQHSAPELIKTVCPPGGFVGMDIPVCRFRPKMYGRISASVRFGPRCPQWCPYIRREVMERALDSVWDASREPRPAAAMGRVGSGVGLG